MAGRRMKYSKPVRRAPENRQQRRLEDKADQILEPDISKRQTMKQEHDFGGRFFRSSPPKEGSFERAYFRSVGSVLSRDGKWFVHDGDGNEIAQYPTRWQAWMHADKYGMERGGDLG